MVTDRFRTAWQSLVLLALALTAGCDMRPPASDLAAYQQKLRDKGDLRTDTAPKDAPYTAEDLVVNFRRIALHHEADIRAPGSEKNWAANPLMRWEGPIRWQIFGAAATDEDRAEVQELMARISRLTGLEITETAIGMNFLILISERRERDDFTDVLSVIHPALAESFRTWRASPEIICIAHTPRSVIAPHRHEIALVAMGTEVRGLLRRACLHEEIVQALGLSNDHPEVRPSIFNDDGEFALLTQHDEQLLRILYDPRLGIGMTAEEAMPIVRRIVAELDLDAPKGQMAAQVKAAN